MAEADLLDWTVVIELKIDNKIVTVEEGATILDAAEKVGIRIPSMCFLKGCRASTSCMVCVVKLKGASGMIPSCATLAVDGMDVESETAEVTEARKMALELLLSDHVGDCMGPCQVTCPAKMDIPLMIRQIASGKLTDAIRTVKKDIALPAVLGRICSAPCENGCRRKKYDDAVSICLLKRFVADVDLESETPFVPDCKADNGKRCAIIGGGPAGLAAAYYLAQEGVSCTIFDDHEKAGGGLRGSVGCDVVDKEIAIIEKLGVKFEMQTRVDSIEEMRKKYNAVFVATGKAFETSAEGLFVGGDGARKRKMAVAAVAAGKNAAVSIVQYLAGDVVTDVVRPFNSRMGKLQDGEVEMFVETAGKDGRKVPVSKEGGFSTEEAVEEANRCLHCDCRKPDSCKLRQYGEEYGAKGTAYKAGRRLFSQQIDHPEIIFEAGKCIDCGLCIQTAAKYKEKLGLSFIGRGFDVKVSVPFDNSLKAGLAVAGKECAQVCPTGALCLR